ncbi:MAG: flagellar assembly protein FliW [Firmicutes bacterium]|nr:flagellar assembly protein FliW [Bacillota bacterium]
MKINTKYLGEVEIEKEKIINFKKGLLGFETLKEYVILNIPNNEAFQCLQSIKDPKVVFIITNPFLFFKDYDIKIDDEELKKIKITNNKELLLYSIVTIPKDIKKMTANLLAPIVINIDKRIAKQIVLENTNYKTKHFIYNETKEVNKNVSTK